jgi:4-amino-4-deoxy-L-arabinose transferase-like glycosyltransferase
LTIVALSIHFIGLRRPVWTDEASTWWTVQQGLGSLVRGVRTDGTPPLYFVVVWFVTHVFGSSEVALRLTSVLAATALVPATYLVGTKLASRRTALIGAALVALDPLIIYYAIESRNYALVQLETLAIVYCAYRAINAPEHLRWWMLVGVAQLVQVWTHTDALFLLPVPTLAALILGLPDRLMTALKAFGVAAVVFVLDLPYLLNALNASATGVGDWITSFWDAIPPPLAVVRSIEVFGFGGRYPSYLGYLESVPAVSTLAVIVSLGMVAAALLPSGRRQSRRGPPPAAVFLLLFVFMPLAALWAWSFVRQPIYLVGRYDTIVLPAFLLLFAAGLDRTLQANRWLGCAVAVFVAGFSVAAVHAELRFPGTDSDASAAEQLVRVAEPGDQIVATGYRRAVVEYYLSRAGRHPTLWSFPFELASHPGWSSTNRLLDNPSALERDASTITTRVHDALEAGHKAWVLSSGTNPVDDYFYRSSIGRLTVDTAASDPAAGVMRLALP